MRIALWLILASGTALSLSGCGDPVAAGRPGKNAAMSGRQEVVLQLANATEAGGDVPGAERMFQQVVKQNPENPGPLLALAEFYKRHHEDKKAIDALNTALTLEPGNKDLERSLANAYINMGEPEKALTILNAAVIANNHEPLLYNSRGVALDQIGSYSEAQKSYRAALDIDPSNAVMYKINLSMSYILEGSYERAISLLRPMLSAPEAPPIVRQNLALAYGLKGESESALKLGLQDLSTKEAEENVKFYRMLAHRHNGGKTQKASTQTVPASVVRELFPEEEVAPDKVALPVQAAAPVAPVVVHEETVPLTIPTVMEPKPEAAAAQEIKPEEMEKEAPPPAPVIHSSVATAPAMPKPTLSAPDVEKEADTITPVETGLPEPVLKPDHI